MLNDDLLTPSERKQVNNIIAKYYLNFAYECLNEGDINQALVYFDKIPIESDAYANSLAEQANVLFSYVCSNLSDINLLLCLLQKVDYLAREMLELDFTKLSANEQMTERDVLVVNQLMHVLSAAHPHEVEPPRADDVLTDQERHLLLYRGYQYKMEKYKEPLQQYLALVYARLEEVAQQPIAPGSLWQQGLSLELRFAHIALKSRVSLPTTTMGMINLAATVHQHLQKDTSGLGRELVAKLPVFDAVESEQKRGVKRQRESDGVANA